MDTYELRRITRDPLAFLFSLAERFGISRAFIKFVTVGAAAFVVNQIALYVLYDSPVAVLLPAKDTAINFGIVTHPDARLLIATILSVETAIVFKFFWSEGWIFRDRRPEGHVLPRFGHFNISTAASSVLTVAVTNILTPVFGISPYITIAAGVFAGFMLNWVWAARLIWPDKPAATDEEP